VVKLTFEGRVVRQFVIASEAKQSIFPRGETWIASSLALLAMTVDEPAHSRGMICPSLDCVTPKKLRAQGMPDAGCTHGPPATK
jgi:hypothetical protein